MNKNKNMLCNNESLCISTYLLDIWNDVGKVAPLLGPVRDGRLSTWFNLQPLVGNLFGEVLPIIVRLLSNAKNLQAKSFS